MQTTVSFLQQISAELEFYSGGDRRYESRERLILPILATPFDSQQQPCGSAFHAVTRDISDSGIGILSTRPASAPYLGLLAQSPKTEEELFILVRVTRCERVGHYYDIGGSISHSLMPQR